MNLPHDMGLPIPLNSFKFPEIPLNSLKDEFTTWHGVLPIPLNSLKFPKIPLNSFKFLKRCIYHITWNFQFLKFFKIPLNSFKFFYIPLNSFKFFKIP